MMWKFLVLVFLVINLIESGDGNQGNKGCKGDPNAQPGCDPNCKRRCPSENPPTRCSCNDHCKCKNRFYYDPIVYKCVLLKDCTKPRETTTTDEPSTTTDSSTTTTEDITTTTDEPTTTTTEICDDSTTTTEEPTTTTEVSTTTEESTTTTEEPSTTTDVCDSDGTSTTEEPTTTTEEPSTTTDVCDSTGTSTTEEPTTTTAEPTTTTEECDDLTTTTEEPTTEECPDTGLTTCSSIAIDCNCITEFKRIIVSVWAVTIKYAYEVYALYNKDYFICNPPGSLHYNALFSQFAYKKTLEELLEVLYQNTPAQVQCVALKLTQIFSRLSNCGESNVNYQYCSKAYIYSKSKFTKKFLSQSNLYNLKAITKDVGDVSRSLTLISDTYLKARWRKGFEGTYKDNFYVSPSQATKNVVYQYKTEVCKYIYCAPIKCQIVKVDNAAGISTFIFLPASGVNNAQAMQLILKNPDAMGKCINQMTCKTVRIAVVELSTAAKNTLNVKPVYIRTWGNLTLYSPYAQTSDIIQGNNDAAYVGGAATQTYELQPDYGQADKDSVSEDECSGVSRSDNVINVNCNRPTFFVKTICLNLDCKTVDCVPTPIPMAIEVLNRV